MKGMRLVSSSVAILVLGGVMQAGAVLSLPVADDAKTQAGMKRIGAAVTFESDWKLYGARLTYGAWDGLALFGGVGLIDIDGVSSTEPYFQIGAQYGLPLEGEAPFDLAIRFGFGMMQYEDSVRAHGIRAKEEADLQFINAGLLVSTKLENRITAYGFVGVAYGRLETKRTRTVLGQRVSHSESTSDTEPAIGGGVILPFDNSFSVFAELMHIDDLFVSLGGRYEF